MSLALFHRTEIEVVEAECLPMSTRGTKPDPFVLITYPEHPSVTHRTKIQSCTDKPTFAQRFVIEAKAPASFVHFAVYDRTDDSMSLLATARIEVGAPGREVGCRWIPLNAVVRNADAAVTEWGPKIRIVWQCTTQMLAVEEAKGPKEGISPSMAHAAGGHVPAPEVVSVTKVLDDGDNVTQTTALKKTANSGAARGAYDGDDDDGTADRHRVTPLQAQLLAKVTAIEDTLAGFMSEVRVRLTKIESRVENVESFINGHARTGTHSSGHDGADAPPGAYWSGRLTTEPTSTTIALTGDSMNSVAKLQGAAVGGHPGGTSALDDIMKNPTRVTAADSVLLANYTFPQVKLPVALERRVTALETAPSNFKVEFASSPASAKRRLEATTKAVSQSYNRMLSSH